MRSSVLIAALASSCLVGGACQSATKVAETEGSEGHFPDECQSDEDCAPDEICVEDFGNTCEPSCEARQPDLDVCGCAEGRYCEAGDDCPTIGCAGGQLCASGECHDVSLAPACAEPTWWSFNSFEAEAGSGVVAIRLAQMSGDANPELVMLRPGSVEIRGLGGGTLPLAETQEAAMLRVGDVDGGGDDLLIASSDAAWLYTSAPANFDDPTLSLELAASFSMADLVDVELGDFGSTSTLDVWLQGATKSELHLGIAGLGFDEPLSFEQAGTSTSTWAVGDLDLDLDGRDDIATGAWVWLGADEPAWTLPSLTLDPPAWLGSSQLALPLAIPEGLAIAWTIGLNGNGGEEPPELHTTLARYLTLDSGSETPSAATVLYPGRPDRLIGPAGEVDQGWIATENDEIVVYRELDGQHCRAVASGNGVYVDGHLDPTDTNRMILLTADGAVEEWLRL